MPAKKGSIPWNKNLTKETDERVNVYSMKAIGRKPTNETRKKISKSHLGKKRVFTEEHKQNMRVPKSQQGRENIRNAIVRDIALGIRKLPVHDSPHSKESIEKMSKSHIGLNSGEKHWNWQDGITPLNRKLRASNNWKVWREAVFERDDYTCQECGKRGIELHPHHIKQLKNYPELAFDVDNGKTLCVSCHLHSGIHKGGN